MDRATSLANTRALDGRKNVSKPAKRLGNRQLDEETEKQIRQDLVAGTKSYRQIAALRRVNKSTVERLARKQLFEPAPDDPEDTETLQFRTRELKVPTLCPGCERETIFKPCVQCRAQQSITANRSQVSNS